mmetsp:Transcript_24117/g.75648  ORF Transcript_24117/g.75648 Transcript_24117/m.75648 type:complete len:146 (-) Transcript_24117:1709-2146(-)
MNAAAPPPHPPPGATKVEGKTEPAPSEEQDDDLPPSPFFHRGDYIRAANMGSLFGATIAVIALGVFIMPVTWALSTGGLSPQQRAGVCWMATGLTWTLIFELVSSPSYDGADGDPNDASDRSASNTKLALRVVMILGTIFWSSMA